MSELKNAFEQTTGSDGSSPLPSPVKLDKGMARLQNALAFQKGRDAFGIGSSSKSSTIKVDLSGLGSKDDGGDPKISLGTVASLLAVFGAIIGLVAWARKKGTPRETDLAGAVSVYTQF
jgi:hypothetical protein